ncbi:MAG: 23S rRNA (uracil(1939)-C(5))-methyltransferase RlmD [Oxalobacteraceae bacterium]|nr:23S rRNA (uracil(1939)-C(5))-methyltransferase RlmD [Oxalobacteraceae bacterium]
MTPTLEIASLDMEARGVGHLPNEDGSPGKVIFVEGALPGELVRFTSYRRKPKWEAAELTELLRSSALRTSPKCHYFGICGGCAMRFVEKKGGVLIGFHERRSSFIADMRTCEILPPKVSAMLQPMRGLIGSLSIRDRLPQIELAVGEREAEFKFEHQDEQVIVLVLRIMAPLSNEDEHLLKAFADQWGIEWWLQTKGPDTAMPWYPRKHPLHYRLPEFGVVMPFKPTDFTQVNHQINSVLVSRALRLLQVQPTDRVADLFCGLGNFTLPLATQAREVLGIEGSSALTERAVSNAKLNGLDQKTFFSSRNLFEFTLDDLRALGKFDRMLIDPPREGAMEVCKAIAEAKEQAPDVQPARIVYVSCNPATLARDAGMLVNVGGYQLSQAGVVNMFPHTAHVESIAVFDRPS